MNKILAFLFAAALTAHGQTSWFVEGGVSSLFLQEEEDQPILLVEGVEHDLDTPVAAPWVALGYRFSDRLSLRATYMYVDGVTETTTEHFVTAPPGGYIIQTTNNSDFHVVTLAPEISFPLHQRVRLSFGPQVSWVSAKWLVTTYSDHPAITYVPRYKSSDSELRLGAHAGLEWTLAPRWSATLRYEYVQLKPGFDYEAHGISAGVRYAF